MDSIAKRLEAYIKSRKFDGGTSECETVLYQIYQTDLIRNDKIYE